MHRVLLSGWVCLCLGCGGPISSDAGADAGVSDAADAARPAPMAPAAPTWGACPPGWSPERLEGAETCAPPARLVCTGATFQPVGSAACEAIGACAGRFPVLPAERPHLHVDASAAPGGDGSEASPFDTLDDALAVGEGAAIALAAGEYTRSVPLPDDLALLGACAAEVRILAQGGSPALVVQRDQRLALSGVTLGGEGPGLTAQGEVSVRDVVVDGALGVGIGGVGATLDVERVVVRGTRSLSDGALGRGISVETGAMLSLRDVVIEDCHEAGLAAGAATIDAERLVIERTTPTAAGRYGAGVAGFGAASITLRESLIDGATEAGVTVEAGTTLSLDRVVIEDVLTEPSRTSGQGIVVRNAPATLSRVTVRRAHGAGLVATGTSVVGASDLTVVDTQLRSGFGSGIASLAGAQIELARAAVLDSAWIAVVVDEGTLRATDLTVARIAESLDLGMAMVVRGGAHAEVERFRFTDARAVGAMVMDAGTTARFAHGVVRGVTETAAHGVGRGLEVDVGAEMTLEVVEIADVVETGVLAFGELRGGTRAILRDVWVHDVVERSCAAATCPTEGGGTGVAALFAAAIEAERLTVEGAPLCGVQVAEQASLDVASGSISGSAIGACVGVPDYDLSRVVAGVVFTGNERNVETATVYVPSRGPLFE